MDLSEVISSPVTYPLPKYSWGCFCLTFSYGWICSFLRRVIHSNNMWGDHDSPHHRLTKPGFSSIYTSGNSTPGAIKRSPCHMHHNFHINPTKRSQQAVRMKNLDLRQSNRWDLRLQWWKVKQSKCLVSNDTRFKWHVFEAKHQGGLFLNPTK